MKGTKLTMSVLTAGMGAGDLDSLVRRANIAETTIVFEGYGSIARPMADRLLQFGARRFVLTDPKAYNSFSPASQCDPHEVGQLKTDVGVARLSSHGAAVRGYRRDLYGVPEGIVSSDSVLIAALDNRRADIGANRRAARMGARLIKVNIEPSHATASVRAYDFRRGTTTCAECQFTARHYADQLHPKSCDAATAGRRTNSPRWLSEIAAAMASIAVLEISAEEQAGNRWFNRERLYSHCTGEFQDSELTANPNCRWNHDRRWRNVVRLAESPSSVRLADLIAEAVGVGPVDSSVQVRFCQQVSLRSGCLGCGRRVHRIHWTTDHESSTGRCELCNGMLRPLPFWSYDTVPVGKLRPVWKRPLSEWGVEPFAVIRVSRDSAVTTFVVGDGTGGTTGDTS